MEDEIVENQLFRKLVIKNFKMNDDNLVIGANRVGRQAMIISGDHNNIHIFKIINRNYFGSIDVENSKISEIYTSILWSDFKNKVIKRPQINRFDYNERKKTWWKFW